MNDTILHFEAELAGAPTEDARLQALNRLAWALHLFDAKRSLDLSLDAAALAEQLQNDRERAQSLMTAGICQWRLTNYSVARALSDTALRLFQKVADPGDETARSGEANALNTLGNVCWSVADFSAAVQYYQQSLALRREIGDVAAEAASLNNLGVVYQDVADYPRALEFHQHSLRLKQAVSDQAGEAVSLNNIGNIYFKSGDYPNAAGCYEKSLFLQRGLGDKYGEADALGNLGNVFAKLGQPQQAIETYQQSLQLRRELGDRLGEANALGNLGVAHSSLGSSGNAIGFYAESLALYQATGNRLGEAYSWHRIGQLIARFDAAQLQQIQRLEPSLLLSPSAASSLRLPLEEAVERRLDKAAAVALRCFHQALDLAETLNTKDLAAQVHRALSLLYKDAGQIAEALEQFEKYHDAEREIFNEESDRKVRNLQVIYQLEEAQREADRQRLEAEKLRIEADNQRIEAEKLRIEADNQRIEAERQRIEADNQRIEADNQRIEAEKQRIEADRQRFEAERQRIEAERQRVETDNQRIEADNQRIEAEKQRIEVELYRVRTIDLTAANQLKSELLAIAAHDLKNPLQVIQGFASLIQENPFDCEEASSMAGKIVSSSERMLKLITDLLMMSALDTGKIALHKLAVDVAVAIHAAAERQRVLAWQKSQTLYLRLDAPCFASVDIERLSDVFDNLIGNAVKYAPPNTAITVSLTQDDRAFRFSVRDEGPGLSESDMQKLFGKFQRLSARPTGGESSTGLGLSIVKELVELHGGRVWAESAGKGKGATFFAELPLV